MPTAVSVHHQHGSIKQYSDLTHINALYIQCCPEELVETGGRFKLYIPTHGHLSTAVSGVWSVAPSCCPFLK